MTKIISTRKMRLLFAGLCAMLLLVLGTISVVSADPNSAYCVQMGYLYKTTPSLNNGSGICQFPDGSWCDAHEFFKGNCNPTPYVTYRSYLMQHPSDAPSLCSRLGGRMYYVHTVYGDVPICVSPDGRTIDLSGYKSDTDAWAYYAYSWLNAP